MSQDFKYLGENPGKINPPWLDKLDVQKTVTKFNYSLWGASTHLYLKHVPASWDSGYKNVVQFKNKQERDSYLKTGNPVVLETDFRINHDNTIRLPIPYDNLINYNYITASYPNAPVPMYDDSTARKDYYYFILDCRYISPNTTEVLLQLDVWTTYMDEVTVGSMQLDRGHYPMAHQADVDTYIKNPLDNLIGLTTVDVNYGTLVQIHQNHIKQFDIGQMYYIIVTTMDISKSGYQEHTTERATEASEPKGTVGINNADAQNGLYYMGLRADDLPTLLDNISTQMPNFFQTIKGVLVCFDTFYPVETFTSSQFLGVTVYNCKKSVIDYKYDFTKDDWNYDEKYSWITKLYTYPYCILEYMDINNTIHQIKYEDLAVGQFYMKLMTNVCLANPTTQAVIMNIGNTTAHQDWTYSIPWATTQINQDYINAYDLTLKWILPQIKAQIELAKSQGDRSADLSSKITKRGNDQSKDFTTHDLDTGATVLANNIDQNKRMSYANMLTQQYSAWNNLNNENTSFAAKGTGTIAAMTNTVAMGALGASSGNPMAVPAIANGVVNQSYNFLTADTMFDIVSQMIEFNLNQSLQIQRDISGLHEDHTFTVQSVDKTISVPLTAENGLINNKANENFATERTNTEYKRDNTYSIAESNRTDTLQLSKTFNSEKQAISLADIIAKRTQAKLGNVIEHGSTNGESANFIEDQYSVHYRVKTQSKDAIARAGDFFLRYGYQLEQNVDWSDWNLMKYFTYWKCDEVWLLGDTVNNNVINQLKNILLNGVTVWRRPENIGHVSIYDNTIGGE